MSRNVVFRVIGIVLLLGLIAAGGFMAYQAGVAHGVAQSPEVVAAIEKAAENGQGPIVPPMMYGYDRPGFGFGGFGHHGFGYRHHFGFFPIGGFCFALLFFFFLIGALRMVFFRPWHHHGPWRGPWGKHWEDGAPPMFVEWHKRAHGETSSDESKSSEAKS